MKDETQQLITWNAIFEGLQDAVLTHNQDFNIVNWNPAAEQFLGFTENEITGKSIFTIIPETLHAEQITLFEAMKSGQSALNFQTFRNHKSGIIFPVSITLSPVKNQEGELIGATQVIRNISATDKLADEKQAILASIIDTSDDAIISKSMEGIITSWNTGAEKIFGYTAKEAIGQPVQMLIPKERVTEEDFILSIIKKGEQIQHFHTTRLSKTGDEIPISLTASPVKDKDGTIIGISKIARNISAEKLAAEKQEILAAIVESSDDAIISKTLDGIISSWNIGAQKIFGYTEQEVIGKHISILIPQHRLNEETQIISSIKKGEKVDHFQTTRINKDGREVDISLTVSPVKDFTGKVIGASKIARDITLQKAAEDMLKKNNRKLKILSEVGRGISEQMAMQAILQKITDATTQITGADLGSFFSNTNETPDSLTLSVLSGPAADHIKRSALTGLSILLQEAFSTNKVTRIDDVTQHSDPVSNWSSLLKHLPIASYMTVPVRSGSGQMIGGLFLAHHQPAVFKEDHEDLVVSLAAQTAIALDNSKLFEEVKDLNRKKDEFIAMASHELKTPLTSLSGFLQILNKTETAPGPKLFVSKSMIILEKLNRLIGDLFDASKIQAGKLQFSFDEFDFVQLINEVIESFAVTQQSHSINFAATAPVLLHGDRLRLEQVLINLINNAIKYSPQADKVDIGIENNSGKLVVLVKDYGIGISKENHEHIFNQFYRVENLNHKISGLGLGLYITREIIERHKGTLQVESDPGTGSVFRIELPLTHSDQTGF
jgi:PAS domain S-box-containing protein